MRVLSFDIGIINLAYSVLEVPDAFTDVSITPETKSLRTKILDWGILCLRDKGESGSSKDTSVISRRLIELLFEHFSAEPFDVVLIENQPCMKNPTMKSIQIMVYTFFMMRNHMDGLSTDVRFVSASNKMKVKHKCDTTHIKASSNYVMNKKTVVAYAANYLELTKEINGDWIQLFNKEKKRDDWADCYAQALHYIENHM